MSNAVIAPIVSLDDYRRARSLAQRSTAMMPAESQPPPRMFTPAVWIYWVPVWVW